LLNLTLVKKMKEVCIGGGMCYIALATEPPVSAGIPVCEPVRERRGKLKAQV
jgi:hypothetical protein